MSNKEMSKEVYEALKHILEDFGWNLHPRLKKLADHEDIHQEGRDLHRAFTLVQTWADHYADGAVLTPEDIKDIGTDADAEFTEEYAGANQVSFHGNSKLN